MADQALHQPRATEQHPSDAFDVVVVGAGPAGSATARRLAQAGCRVLLAERSRFNAPRVGESLAPAVQPLLRELGVWDAFLALGPWPSRGTQSVWGSDVCEAHSHHPGAQDCGWHVDRLAFDRMLADGVAQAGGDVRIGVVAGHCEPQAGGWRVQLTRAGHGAAAQGDVKAWPVTARLLIDATGRSASLARALGAQRALFDSMVGVAAHWAGDASLALSSAGASCEPHCILVETVPEGWWYSAPLPCAPARVAMVGVLFTDADLCGQLKLTVAPQWQGRLDQAPATRARLRAAGRSLRWGPHAFSAVSHRLRPGDKTGAWFAVGDAALAVDPISGNGVVRALRTGRAAAESALAWLQAGSERQRAEVLAAYEAARDRECSDYLVEREAYYAIEGRWADAPFWQRRRAAPVAA